MQLYHIGRSRDNEIVVQDPSVSRKHAQLFFDGEDAYLIDLGSTNGTFVNGRKINGKVRLDPTDVIRVGTQVLPWQHYRNAEAAPPATQVATPAPQEVPHQPAPSSSSLKRFLPYGLGIAGVVALVLLLFFSGLLDQKPGAGGDAAGLEGKWTEVADPRAWISFEEQGRYVEGYDDLFIFEGKWKTAGKDSLFITRGDIQVPKSYALDGDQLTVVQGKVKDSYQRE